MKIRMFGEFKILETRCISGEKSKKSLAAFLTMCLLACSAAFPASTYAYEFDFDLPDSDHIVGGMQSTYKQIRGTQRAYISTKFTTISTMYFLSPQRFSSVLATEVVYKTVRSASYFTWQPDYGGLQGEYCLSACPDVQNGEWESYRSEGNWVV